MRWCLCKNTLFPDQSTGLCQEGHPTVKHCFDFSYMLGFLTLCQCLFFGFQVRVLDPLFNMSNSQQLLRFGSWNVGTMKGRSHEIVESLTRRRVDICCVQETRWRGGSARFITGKDSRYKFFWTGNTKGTNGVGLLVAEKWVEKVIQVDRISDRLMSLKLVVGTDIVNILSIYVPQVGLSDDLKIAFYDSLISTVSKIANSEIMFLCGDFNGHIGSSSSGFEGIHGGYGIGETNSEGCRLLDFAVANGLSICNSFFSKRPSHLITYHSGDCRSQIDFILVKRNRLKFVKDCKVFPNEECVPQHKLLVCDVFLKANVKVKQKFTPKPRVWKLKDDIVKQEFENTFVASLAEPSDHGLNDNIVEGLWAVLKNALLKSAHSTCGMTKKGTWHQETWWWSDELDDIIKLKRKLWKSGKTVVVKKNISLSNVLRNVLCTLLRKTLRH